MSEQHLSEGSNAPPLEKDKLRLYSMRFCPYAQRVRLVLDAKNIPYDVVNVNLTEKPDWLFEKSPEGKVPVIELEEGTLYESLIIAEFLDEKFPQRQLYSKDPFKKAKEKLLIERFHKVISALYKIQYHANKNLLDEHLEEFFGALEVFETELGKRQQLYFGGDKPGMVDYMIWPWCERADVMKIVGGDRFVLPKGRFMRLMQWRQAMKDDETVASSYIEPSVYARYYQSRVAGCPDYDLISSQ